MEAFLSLTQSKLGSVRRIWREAGLRGLLAVMTVNAPLVWLRPSWWRDRANDPHFQGRLVELRGNRVCIEGRRFHVGGAAIPTGRKSLFLHDRYEIEERRALATYLDPTLPVVELGGSIGVVACIVNGRLQDPERHVVVEANPDLVPLLERNRARNKAKFTVLQRAIAYGEAEIAFHRRDFLESGIHGGDGRPVMVPTTNLREVLEGAGFERCTVICDIEGAEIALVANEAELMRERVAILVMEAHPSVTGVEAARGMLERLISGGFVPVFREQETWALLNTALVPRGDRPEVPGY